MPGSSVMVRVLGVGAMVLGPCAAAAQVTHFGADGNLQPTVDLGCVASSAFLPTHTAADLALVARNCVAAQAYPRAVEAFIVMQVFGVFDTRRVADRSAHQAVAVLGQQIAAAIPPADGDDFEAAVAEFGGAGSPRHSALCQGLRASGPPTYSPVYMIQHGMMAFMRPDDPPLVDGFDANIAWDGVLTDFLNCPRG